jgi:hypothetical protein
MHLFGLCFIIILQYTVQKRKVCYSVFVKCAKAIDKPLRFSGFDAHVHEFVIQGLRDSERLFFWFLVFQN